MEECDVVYLCETVVYLLFRMTLHLSEIIFPISALIVLSNFIIIVFFTIHFVTSVYYFYLLCQLLIFLRNYLQIDSFW